MFKIYFSFCSALPYNHLRCFSDGHTIREIKTTSGASVYKTTQSTPIPGMSTFAIRGTRTQIMEAIRLICQKSGTKVSKSL